jgi:ankyrin repeat protein
MTRAQHPQFSFLGDALLRLAAQTGAAKVALQLQRQGEDPFWPDAADSAFYDALCRGDGNLAWQMLEVEHMANRGGLPDLTHYLELALDRNDNAAVTLLLKFSVELKNLMPFQVLHAAIATDNLHRVESLIMQRGIAIAFQSHGAERSVLHYAIRKGSAQTLVCLLDRSNCIERAAGLCAKDSRTGNTALHFAAASGELEKLRLILDFDPGLQGSIDAENSAGKTPLALALEAGRSDMAALLRSRGAHPRSGN